MVKVAVTLSLAIVFAAFGDILFCKGMKLVGEVKLRSLRDIPALLKLAFSHPIILTGTLCMAIYFGSYIAALTWADVSVANPLTALSYVIATAYAIFIMRENAGRQRWMGIALVTIGSIFVGLSS